MARVPPAPGMSRLGPNIIGMGVSPGGSPPGSVPGGGMTLDALINRQKLLSNQQIELPQMTSPMQGVGYVAQSVMQGLNQGRADRDLAEGRQALAQAMTQFNPETGEFTPEAMQVIGALEPDKAFTVLHDMAESRRQDRRLQQEHDWTVEGREDTQKSAADLAAQSQAATAHENELNRAADDARQRLADAKAEGRQDDAQQAAQELAQLNAKLDAEKAKTTAETEAAKPQTDIAKIEADFKAGRINEQQRDEAVKKATYVAPTETYSDVITGEAASAQGLDPTKQWQQNRASGKWEIAGGSGISLNLPPAEMAARIALGDEFQKGVPQLLQDIKAGAATGIFDQGMGKLGWGRSGQIQRQVLSGVDALVRHLTGAGKSQSEAEEYASRYLPVLTDTADTLADKITRLSTELDAIKKGVMQGRGGGTPAAGAPATGGSSDIDKIVERNR